MNKSVIVKCNNIDYRKGYIEIMPHIHHKLINMEVWEIDAEQNIDNIDIEDDSFPEDSVVANIEIELSVENAQKLIQSLQWAISNANLT